MLQEYNIYEQQDTSQVILVGIRPVIRRKRLLKQLQLPRIRVAVLKERPYAGDRDDLSDTAVDYDLVGMRHDLFLPECKVETRHNESCRHVLQSGEESF